MSNSKEITLLPNGEMIGNPYAVQCAKVSLALKTDDPEAYYQAVVKMSDIKDPHLCGFCGEEFTSDNKMHDVVFGELVARTRCEKCNSADQKDKRADALSEGFDSTVWKDVPIECKHCGELSDKTDLWDICPLCKEMIAREKEHDARECAIAEGFDNHKWCDVPINCKRCGKLSDKTDPKFDICPTCHERGSERRSSVSSTSSDESRCSYGYGYGYYGRDDESEYNPYEDEDERCHCGDEGCAGDCGVLSCGCCDVCRGRCGRDEYYF